MGALVATRHIGAQAHRWVVIACDSPLLIPRAAVVAHLGCRWRRIWHNAKESWPPETAIKMEAPFGRRAFWRRVRCSRAWRSLQVARSVGLEERLT